MKKWLFLAIVIVGLLAFAAIIWFAGPFLGFGDFLPLEGWEPRLLIILIVCGGIGARLSHPLPAAPARGARSSRRACSSPGDGGSDAKVLSDRMTEALATLKRSSGKSQLSLRRCPGTSSSARPAPARPRRCVNSGLKFPLAGADGGAAIAGIGGTRYCDWWFTDDAVLIDTAGRYTTQDSDAKADKKSWLSLPRRCSSATGPSSRSTASSSRSASKT